MQVKREHVKHVSAADLTTEEWIKLLQAALPEQSTVTYYAINETPETCHTFTRPIMEQKPHFRVKSESLYSANKYIFYETTYSLMTVKCQKRICTDCREPEVDYR